MSSSGGAPQREQPNPPKVRRGFTFDVQNAHRATTRATQPAKSPQGVHFRCSKCAPRHNESNPTRQKSAEGSLSMFKMRTAPQREQPNPPKVRRGFTFDVQNARRATTRATQPAKSPQRIHFRCSKMRTAPWRDATLRSDMGAAPHGDTKS